VEIAARLEFVDAEYGGPSADAARLTFDFFGTALFAPRFLVQWIIGKMKGQSIMPVGFWYFSLAGGIVTLVYAIHSDIRASCWARPPP
jgi:lipid-A-disaccharide synthase-like uncharacterized protein